MPIVCQEVCNAASRLVLETYSAIDGKYRDPSLEQGGKVSEPTLSVHLPFSFDEHNDVCRKNTDSEVEEGDPAKERADR